MTAIIDQRPTFCTLFLLSNALLTKDVGLITYGMRVFGGYDAFGTAYPDAKFPNLKYVPGFRFETVPKITGKARKDQLLWLKKNAKRIDVLNIYHLNRFSFRDAIVYRLHNPKGKVYLKFDGAPLTKSTEAFKNSKGIKKCINGALYIIKRMVFMIMIRAFTLVSTEFQENAEILSKKLHHKIIYVPNPSNPNEIREYRPFSERSNVIFTAGRLGTKQKATEILLEAFAKIAYKIPNWKLKLAGGIRGNMNIADDFFAKYPDLKDRIIFTGNIADREEMTEAYRDAKIFAFPSRWEGCSLALGEALRNGLFVVSSNIRPNELMTQHFKFAFGHDVDDVDGLAEKLLYACTHESEIEALALKGREAALRRCDLKRISENIAEELKRT